MKHLIETFGASFGFHRVTPKGPFRTLKVALVADELTRSCLAFECQVRDITPLNYTYILKVWKPDLLFVESAWHGLGNAWKYKIASFPDHPERNNNALRKVVAYARELGIPCVFWNREDGVHFERFFSSAKLFDYIFTVDGNSVPRYRALIGQAASVAPLLFAVQPAIHFPSPRGYLYRRACFLGSYSAHTHNRRRSWQEILFAASSELGLTVFDRNSDRRSPNYRYPDLPWLEVRPGVHHTETAQIYRDYMVSLNVNTVEGSGTMFSRRLIEILACGGLAVTTPGISVDRYFRDYCHVVTNEAEARDLMSSLKNGLTPRDRDMVAAGAEYALKQHSWAHRVEEVMKVISQRKTGAASRLTTGEVRSLSA